MEETGTDGRGVADDGYQITLAARLHPQDAEAAVLVVEGHPLARPARFSRSGASCRFPTRRSAFLFQDHRTLFLRAAHWPSSRPFGESLHCRTLLLTRRSRGPTTRERQPAGSA